MLIVVFITFNKYPNVWQTSQIWTILRREFSVDFITWWLKNSQPAFISPCLRSILLHWTGWPCSSWISIHIFWIPVCALGPVKSISPERLQAYYFHTGKYKALPLRRIFPWRIITALKCMKLFNSVCTKMHLTTHERGNKKLQIKNDATYSWIACCAVPRQAVPLPRSQRFAYKFAWKLFLITK
jgi:hypothetical protein